MKKIYLFGIIASAALAMTSCSSDETTENVAAQGNVIEFGTYLGRDAQTRATANMNDEELKKSGFGVFAVYTGQNNFSTVSNPTPNFMNNQKIEWKAGTTGNEGAWEYSPLKYWPNNQNDKVSFFAYAPYDQNKSWSTNYIAYTVENDVTKQVDLLFAPAHKDQAKQNINDKISFKFSHALARIGFSAAYAIDATDLSGNTKLDDNTTITINKVELRKKDATTTDNGVFYTNGNLDVTENATTWKDQKGTQKFTLGTSNFRENKLNNNTEKIDLLNKDDSYVMIIPQETEFEVYIEYTVTTTDTSLPDNKSEITNKITTTVSSINFEANKSYTLNLVLGMTSVKIGASVTDWATDQNATTNVNVPQNTTTNTIN